MLHAKEALVSIFGKIKDAIFGKKAQPAPGGQATETPTGGTTTGTPTPTQSFFLRRTLRLLIQKPRP